MKHLLDIVSLVMMLFSTYVTFAQTPFDAFSPETSRPILDGDSIAAWRAEHRSDTVFCAIVADLRNEQLLLVDITTSSVLAYAPFTDEMKNWISVDPLADKNIFTSPYLYCNGNPVMFIDPLGMDTLNLNSNGTVRNYIQSDIGCDVINYMNNEGEVYASRTMPIHSMDCVYDQDVEMKDAKGNDIIRHMFVISINGDQLGEDAFKFIAENMSGTYEWAFLQTGEPGVGKNYISTSGQQGRNCVQGWFIRRLPDNSNIRHVSHNHPTNENYTQGVDDKHAQNWWDNLRVKFDPNIKFSIYAVPIGLFVEIPIRR